MKGITIQNYHQKLKFNQEIHTKEINWQHFTKMHLKIGQVRHHLPFCFFFYETENTIIIK